MFVIQETECSRYHVWHFNKEYPIYPLEQPNFHFLYQTLRAIMLLKVAESFSTGSLRLLYN